MNLKIEKESIEKFIRKLESCGFQNVIVSKSMRRYPNNKIFPLLEYSIKFEYDNKNHNSDKVLLKNDKDIEFLYDNLYEVFQKMNTNIVYRKEKLKNLITKLG